MTQINDIHGHLVCQADWRTGRVENLYNKQWLIAILPIGGELIIYRRGTQTLLRRLPTGDFYVYSMDAPEIHMQ